MCLCENAPSNRNRDCLHYLLLRNSALSFRGSEHCQGDRSHVHGIRNRTDLDHPRIGVRYGADRVTYRTSLPLPAGVHVAGADRK